MVMDDPLTAELYAREIQGWEIFKCKEYAACPQPIASDRE